MQQSPLYPEKFKLENAYNGRVSDKFLNTIRQLFDKEITNKVIYLLGLEVNKILDTKEIIKNGSVIKNTVLYLFEFYPFFIKPLFIYSKEIRIIHRKLFNITFRYFIYDMLKEKYKEAFATDFGESFEKYIRLGIEELGLIFLDENDLRNKHNFTGKVVDYLVEDCILVECKGIELAPIPNVKPTKSTLKKHLGSSIVKAIKEQAVNVLKMLNIRKEDAFVIIVTYKELNIGFGSNVLESIFTNNDEIKYIQKFIEPNKIFILNIEEWENLISYVKSEKIELKKILKIVEENEKKDKSKLMSIHLNKIFGAKPCDLDYLVKEYNEMFNRISSALK